MRTVVAGFVLGLSTTFAVVASAADAPTFTRDVAPILYSHCVECHRATMFAPMPLVTYQDARPYAQVMKRRVAARTMPCRWSCARCRAPFWR